MTTAKTIVDDAWIESRIATADIAATSNQETIGLRFLNRIIARLSAKKINIPYSTSESFSITASSQSYTMGAAGTASSARARKITNCYIRDTANNDYPVSIISEKDWNSIPTKSDQGRPYMMFYDPVYPIGVIYFYFKPDQTYTAYIESLKDLHASLLIGDTVNLPSEYEDALVITLAHKISRAFGGPNEASLRADVMQAWSEIQGLNISQRVPMATLPFSNQMNSDWLFDGYDSGL